MLRLSDDTEWARYLARIIDKLRDLSHGVSFSWPYRRQEKSKKKDRPPEDFYYCKECASDPKGKFHGRRPKKLESLPIVCRILKCEKCGTGLAAYYDYFAFQSIIIAYSCSGMMLKIGPEDAKHILECLDGYDKRRTERPDDAYYKHRVDVFMIGKKLGVEES